MSVGGVIKYIKLGFLTDAKISIPPLPEQRRIAEVLDRAEALRAKRRASLTQLDTLKQSIFLDMFGDPISNPRKWPTVYFAEICERVTVGIVVQPASYYVSEGVPALRSLNIKPGRIVLQDLVFFSKADNETRLSKTKLKAGDVVLVRSGQPGTAAVVPGELDGVNAIDLLIERARGFLEAATLSEVWIERMSQRALLLEAHHTTHIEGTELTLDEAARLWAGDAVPGADRDDVRELLNYRDAFGLVSEYLGSGEPITEGLIREIHKRLVEGVRGGAAEPGRYRTIQNYVANSRTREIIYTPPPPEAVAPLMRELVEWLRADTGIHPVLVAGIAQFQLVHIHPFVDGNGRASRLLSTLCLYRSGYDFKRLFTLSEFYDRDRSAFYWAIQSVREQEMDLTGWLEFFVGGLAQQLEEVKARGTMAIRRDILVRQHRLNERQGRAIEYLLERGKLGIEEFEALAPGVHRRTLQRDLQGLVERGVAVAKGAARAVRYHLKSKHL